jgi:hypothetical protein
MYVNVKMIPVETVPVIRGGGMKRAVERMNSSMIYLTHFKNLCKCYNEPQFSTTLNLCHAAPSENKKKTVVAIPTSSTIDFFLIHLFTCAYIVWVISPPCPLPHSLPSSTPHFQAEPVLLLSLILLKKRLKHNKGRETVFAS